MKKSWALDIDCPNCAAKLEDALSRLPGVETINVDYVRKTVTLTAPDADFDQVAEAMLRKAVQVEPDARIFEAESTSAHGAASAGHKPHNHEHGCDCGHGHNHHHGHTEDGKDSWLQTHALLLRAGVTAALLLIGALLLDGVPATAVLVLGYLLISYDVLLKAGRNIGRGQIFDENFLMTVASIGAMLMGDCAEGIAVMLLYQVGVPGQGR